MRSPTRAVFRSVLIMLWLVICFPFTWCGYLVGYLPGRDRGVKIFFRGCCLIMSLRVVVHGSLAPVRPLLLVSNHSSYLDVFALGSLYGLRFTPKREVASWPIVGYLCKLAGCVFIDRHPRRTRDNQDNLRASLEAGEAVSLFPEATTTDGARVLPFRSSYFSLAEESFRGQQLTVQPVAIACTKVAGLPMISRLRATYAWYGDMFFFPHLWECLQLPSMTVTVVFLSPLLIEGEVGNRKALAALCQRMVESGLDRARSWKE